MPWTRRECLQLLLGAGCAAWLPVAGSSLARAEGEWEITPESEQALTRDILETAYRVAERLQTRGKRIVPIHPRAAREPGCAVLGVGITVAGYMQAAHQEEGGKFKITYGLVIFGLVMLGKDAYRFMRYGNLRKMAQT